MDLIHNTKNRRDFNKIKFFTLLRNSKIEEAIHLYVRKQIQIDYNGKNRIVSKQAWIKYLKKTILNKFTELVQFKVEKSFKNDEEFTFKIFMICKKVNGTLDFTEISLNNYWKDNYINKMKYNLISH